MSSCFKIGFSMDDYIGKGILPSLGDYMKHDEIVNQDIFQKGDIDRCVWNKYRPQPGEISSQDFINRERNRILYTGAWIRIKEEVIWLPPMYYGFLQYGMAGSQDPEFRLKRLKQVYFKLEARNNPGCKGTMTVKNRQDGDTTIAMSNILWECKDGVTEGQAQMGIQSKTRADAINPCWLTVQTLWQNYPLWYKNEFYSDYASGDSIAEKLKFMRNSDDSRGIKARNIIMQYYPAVYNAMDGRNDMKICYLDEFLKWVECNFGDSFTNYSKFIMPGFQRRGMFDMTSSPADKDCQSYRDGYELWEKSDPNNIDEETGTTESRIHRWYSNPLDGILGAYDKWGDADPEKIYDHIMRERKAVPPEKRLAEIRGFPLTKEEMWGSIEGGGCWSNTDGIKKRLIYITGRRFKDEKTKEPCKVYGNLERIDGYIDGDVVFRPTDLNQFDVQKARFCFSYLPDEDQKQKLDDIRKPPQYVENCLGIDPFNHRYPTKNPTRQSDGAMVNRKFLDVFETGIKKVPTMIYCCRPKHRELFFEDCLKAAIFNRALIQYENRHDGLENFAEDRGYSDWLLPTIGAPIGSTRKGDAPSGKGRFLEEGMALLDAATNTPLRPDDPYYLDFYWFTEQLEDYLKFNDKDTQLANLTMADIQSLVGCVKILHKKIRQPSELNDAALDYLFS